MSNSSPAEDFSTTTENNLDLPFTSEYVNTLRVDPKWVTAIGVTLAMFYALLDSYVPVHDAIYVANKDLATRFKKSPKTIERYLSELEKLGWIKRNTFNTPLGRERQIILLKGGDNE